MNKYNAGRCGSEWRVADVGKMQEGGREEREDER